MRTPFRVPYQLVVVPQYVLVVGGKLRDIEGEATDIEPIGVGAVAVVRKRDQSEIRGHERVQRMKWNAGQCQKVDRLSGAARRVLENTVSRILG